MTNAVPQARTVAGAVVAGCIGGALMIACYAVMNLYVLGTPGFSLATLFAFDASVLVGKLATVTPAFVALGASLHVLVSIGWATGFALAAQRERQLITRPIISGAAFGLVVYFAMQLVLVAANLYRTPTPSELGVALLAHLAFFGIPVALVTARSAPPAG